MTLPICPAVSMPLQFRQLRFTNLYFTNISAMSIWGLFEEQMDGQFLPL